MKIEKNINVKKFIEGYNLSKNKDNYISDHILKDKYVPYEEKLVRCEKVVEKTTSTTLMDKKVYKKNTPGQFVLFTLTLISLYTNIEVNFSNPLEDFNLLDKEDLVSKLVNAIPSHEYNTMQTVFNMVNEDFYENNRSMTSFLENKITTLSIAMENISEALKEVSKNPEIANLLTQFIQNK